ncbi:BrnT family toxin [Rhizobium sp. LCM 4573]|uniref:BrnT family toxin n=1 Tax=Rhizobium sp. LCM 4573 TaxID=1848291 RepID=UPI000A64EEDD|nr:BrnT family toxin [Rhizobium sp. LCM 4573]
MGPPESGPEQAKHRVSFQIAQHVWDDPHHLIIPDAVYDGEERWLAIGSVSSVTILVVAHVYRSAGAEEVIRIISARKATPHERRRYEQEAF